jgi:cytochrome b561
MKNRTVLLLWLDCSMLVAVVLLECLSLTGLQLHEWLGFLLCPLVLLHVVLQWQWFITQFQRVLTAGAWRIRINAALNLLLLIIMAAVLVSGGLVSNQSVATFGERFGRLRLWSEIHGTLNFILVVLVGLHLALNWDWIVAALRRWQTKRPGLVQRFSVQETRVVTMDLVGTRSTASQMSREESDAVERVPTGPEGRFVGKEPRSGVTVSSSPRNKQWLRWLGRVTAVLAVAFIAAGSIYFAMARMTHRPHQRHESGGTPNFRPQGRRQSFPDGMRELSVTAATVVIVVVVGRGVLRLRL